MSAAARIARKTILTVTAFAFCMFLGGCNFEAPITTSPTRKVDPRLLGEWESKNPNGKPLKVGRWDDSFYVALWDGVFWRVHHSDVAQTAFVSVQFLDDNERKYAYMTWTLSTDGTQLELRNVRDRVLGGSIPYAVRGDAALVQKFLAENLRNPDLFEESTFKFTKTK